ncbi:MAG: serine hydrolase [Bulleidia sp.]
MKNGLIQICKALLLMALVTVVILTGVVVLTGVSEHRTLLDLPDSSVEPVSEPIIQPEPVRSRDTELEEELNDYVSTRQFGQYDLAFRVEDMENHEVYAYNTETDFFAASVYKLPLAMLYYDMIADGTVTPDTTYYFGSDMVEDYGILTSEYLPGSYVPLRRLLETMIVYSDNDAAHILFEHLGGWLVYKDEMRKYTDFVDCYEFDTYDNVTCCDVVGDVLSYLYEHQDRYAQLITFMEQAEPGNFLDGIIQTGMPQKYGSFDSSRNAAGFVDTEHDYTIVVLTDLGAYGETVMAEINAMVYNHFNAH